MTRKGSHHKSEVWEQSDVSPKQSSTQFEHL